MWQQPRMAAHKPCFLTQRGQPQTNIPHMTQLPILCASVISPSVEAQDIFFGPDGLWLTLHVDHMERCYSYN